MTEQLSFTPKDQGAPTQPLNRQELTATLEAGFDAIVEGDNFQRYLDVMSRFHHYSENNILLILMQKPDATQVASYTRWQSLGRQVREGERGLRIWAPMNRRVTEVDEETGCPQGQEHTVIKRIGYKPTSTFDISQTEGEPLPEPPLIEELRESSNAGMRLFGYLEQLAEQEEVEIVYAGLGPSHGYYSPSRQLIALNITLEGDQPAKTLAHELAHHLAGHRQGTNRRDAETVGEGVAYVVMQHFGIDASDFSFGYIAEWAEDREVLDRNLTSIRDVAHAMITGIEELYEAQDENQNYDQVGLGI